MNEDSVIRMEMIMIANEFPLLSHRWNIDVIYTVGCIWPYYIDYFMLK